MGKFCSLSLKYARITKQIKLYTVPLISLLWDHAGQASWRGKELFPTLGRDTVKLLTGKVRQLENSFKVCNGNQVQLD